MKHLLQIRRLCSLIVCFCCLLLLTGCTDLSALWQNAPAPEPPPVARNIPQKTATTLAADKNGMLTISRSLRESITPMGEADTWTIFVYLCGSDLESGDGTGSDDLWEMKLATTNENVRFVVQTGGATHWRANYIRSTKLNRFVISAGNIRCVQEDAGETSMGSADTLADFLTWGTALYPAAHMGLVLWNHGSGSISGVCFDETFEQDSLSLTEIGAALQYAADGMTDLFEFVGFDACLMATVETANLLVPYARYMIASQDTEPGGGWDYSTIGTWLTAHPDADGAALGKVICDSFYDACEAQDAMDEATISCIDLSKLDALLQAWNEAAGQMNTLLDSPETRSKLLRGIRRAMNFGSNNRMDGYTNMVDMAAMLDCCEALSGDAAKKALTDCVYYMKNGSEQMGVCGLSTYYPLCINGSAELAILKEICISPNYLRFADRVIYGASTGGVLDSYATDWFTTDGFWSGSWFDWGTQSDTDSFSGTGASYWNSDCWTENSKTIEFDKEPFVDNNGYYTFTLSPKGMAHTASIYHSVYVDYEETYSIDLGVDDNIYYDTETGQVFSNFDGKWFSLPDGQYLTVYLIDQQKSHNIYVSPIQLNGSNTHLRFRLDIPENETDDCTITLLGTWFGLDEDGQAARDTDNLQDDDVIIPLHPAYYYDDDEETTVEGAAYTYHTTDVFEETALEDNLYYYNFIINDIYGLQYSTDFSCYEIKKGEVYSY